MAHVKAMMTDKVNDKRVILSEGTYALEEIVKAF
jgi:hypothetical protein